MTEGRVHDRFQKHLRTAWKELRRELERRGDADEVPRIVSAPRGSLHVIPPRTMCLPCQATLQLRALIEDVINLCPLT